MKPTSKNVAGTRSRCNCPEEQRRVRAGAIVEGQRDLAPLAPAGGDKRLALQQPVDRGVLKRGRGQHDIVLMAPGAYGRPARPRPAVAALNARAPRDRRPSVASSPARQQRSAQRHASDRTRGQRSATTPPRRRLRSSVGGFDPIGGLSLGIRVDALTSPTRGIRRRLAIEAPRRHVLSAVATRTVTQCCLANLQQPPSGG
jgi:hypothetical protein